MEFITLRNSDDTKFPNQLAFYRTWAWQAIGEMCISETFRVWIWKNPTHTRGYWSQFLTFINRKVLGRLVIEEIVGNMTEINTTKFQIKWMWVWEVVIGRDLCLWKNRTNNCSKMKKANKLVKIADPTNLMVANTMQP